MITRESIFEKYRPEVTNDVIPRATVDYVGMDVRVKFDSFLLNSGRNIQLFAGRTRFTHCCAVFHRILPSTGSS